MDQHASQALRSADRTSLGIAVNLVKSGEADAVVSAGNSGAFLAIALIKLRTIEGIARPAIATVWPALNGPTVLLDSGANVDCRPEWLEQFGMMGSAYATAVLGIATSARRRPLRRRRTHEGQRASARSGAAARKSAGATSSATSKAKTCSTTSPTLSSPTGSSATSC